MKKKFNVEILYEDESGFNFDVELEGTENEIHGEIMMITRGTLLSSNGCRATAYKDDGFDVCSYTR